MLFRSDTAQRALERVASGETDTIEGWLAYGAALNEGRGLFASDEQFGKWLVSVNLAHTDRHERAAAMWGAGCFPATGNLVNGCALST